MPNAWNKINGSNNFAGEGHVNDFFTSLFDVYLIDIAQEYSKQALLNAPKITFSQNIQSPEIGRPLASLDISERNSYRQKSPRKSLLNKYEPRPNFPVQIFTSYKYNHSNMKRSA